MNKFVLVFCLVLFLIGHNSVFADELPYDYSDTQSIPIKLSILEEVTSKSGAVESQSLFFRVRDDVIYNGRTIAKKNDVVKAKLETVIPRGMNGFPAELIVDNFNFPEIKKSQLVSTYTKKGMNRSLWVYPLKWALTPIPFAGSFTNFIMGGEAKIKKTDIITVYYYPNWK